MAFLTVNNFFLCIFKNTDQKNICVSIVLKGESKPKHKEKFCGGFSLKTKNALFWGSKMVILKSQISKNFKIWAPLNFSKMKNFDALVTVCVRTEILELDF